MIKDTQVLKLSLSEIVIRHYFENESENSSKELGGLWVVGSDLCWIYLLVDEMHDMHLQIHELTVDGMLGWRVEMELLGKEVGLWNVLVEETNRRGAHEVIVWLLGIFDWEEE